MGWQDRDYAKWTDEERNRFLASSVTYPPQPRISRLPAGRAGLLRPGASLAILVSGVLFALGHFPTSHPIVPSLRFQFPGLSGTPQRQTGSISGPGTAALGSTLNLHGTAPQGDGAVTIKGSYDGGRSWQILATAGANGSYAAQIPLEQSGVLQIRILFADGAQAVGSITVS